jgi:SPP1 gp7 family putative phage head morphogenesis protein
MQHAAQALDTMKPGISAMLNRVNVGAFRAMVGLAGDGSPLSRLLARSGEAIRQSMLRELQRSIALGRNPKVTAAAVRKTTGMGLQRALTIARTEQMRVYREATLETYREMGVTQYERIASYDDRTCIACLSMAGEIVSSEFAVDDHPMGRCTAVPIIPGIANPTMESSESWFGRQSEATQRNIMGPGRYDAYKSGAANWKDMAVHHTDPVWGGSYSPIPVSQLGAAQVAAAA